MCCMEKSSLSTHLTTTMYLDQSLVFFFSMTRGKHQSYITKIFYSGGNNRSVGPLLTFPQLHPRYPLQPREKSGISGYDSLAFLPQCTSGCLSDQSLNLCTSGQIFNPVGILTHSQLEDCSGVLEEASKQGGGVGNER